MALTEDQIRLLTSVISETKEHELDCDQFLVHLAEWSERVLNGESIANATQEVQNHLKVCPECQEEFEMLMEVLRSNLQQKDNG